MLKKLLLPLDLLLFVILYLVFGAASSILAITCASRKHSGFSKKRVLQITHYNINDIAGQGDRHIVFKSDLGGYFERVVTVLFSSASQEISDKEYGRTHRVVHIPQKPGHFLNKIGFDKTTYALSALSFLFNVATLARQEDVGLIRAQDPFFFGYIARNVSMLTNRPYAVHVIQNYDISTRCIQRLVFPPFVFNGVERMIEQSVLKDALFVSSSYANYKFYAISHGADPATSFSLRTPVGECHFKTLFERKDLKAKYGIDGHKVILYVGRLEKVKFVDDLIETMVMVKKQFGDVKLLIAGRGSLKDSLGKMAIDFGVGNDVIFLGNVAQEDLADLYYTADVIVFTHAGITLVEAALSSKPVACYDHDWAGEFIGYNERGVLSQFRDIRGLAESVIGLLKEPKHAVSLGNAARDFAMQNFNSNTITTLERHGVDRFFVANIRKGCF